MENEGQIQPDPLFSLDLLLVYRSLLFIVQCLLNCGYEHINSYLVVTAPRYYDIGGACLVQ